MSRRSVLIQQSTNLFIFSVFAFCYIFLNIPGPGAWISDSTFQMYDLIYKSLLYSSVIFYVLVNVLYSFRQLPRTVIWIAVIGFPLALLFNILFVFYILVFMAAFFCVKNIKSGCFSYNILKLSVILSLFFAFLQALYFRSEDGRPALSFIDPNFSAFYVFILFCISYILRMRLVMMFCFVLGMFMLSRAFLLAVVVFIFIERIRLIFYFARCFKLSHPFIMVLCSLFLVFAVGTALRTFGGNDVADYDSGISRFSTVNDGSNRLRFQLNDQFLNALTQSHELQFRGVTREYYTSNYAPLIPHNGFFEFVRINGLLLAVIFISFVFLTLLNNSTKSTFPFIFSYILYLCFLPIIPAGISLMLVSVVYAVILNKSEVTRVSYNCS